MSAAQGGEGRPPEQVAGAPLDCLNALLSTAGILMSLRHRDRTGEGQHAQCAQLAAGLFALSEVYRTSEGLSDPGRLDHARRSLGLGYGIERTTDGWVFVCCPDEAARERLGDLLGGAGPSVWSTRTAGEWLAALRAANVPAMRVREPFDGALLDEPFLTDTSRVVEVDDPALGRVRQPGGFVRFSDARLPVATGGPALGQHTREVLREIGIDDEAVAALLDAAVVREGAPG